MTFLTTATALSILNINKKSAARLRMRLEVCPKPLGVVPQGLSHQANTELPKQVS